MESKVLMSRLTSVLAASPRDLPLADRLIGALADTLDVDGGAITIGYAEHDRTTLCATDRVASRIEELQDLLREGPSLDAFRTGRSVAVGLQEQGVRWPLLSRGLSEQFAPMSLFGIPMRPDRDLLGVVGLYRHERPHRPFDIDGAEFLSGAVGIAIVGRFDRPDSTDMDWSTRDRINQATGMVVAQLGVPPHDALALLRAHAFAHAAGLDDVSRAVVDRRLDFRTTDADPRGGDR